jgi:hypothetical protein
MGKLFKGGLYSRKYGIDGNKDGEKIRAINESCACNQR